ncbi:agmatinase [Desulfonauticus submarinus]|uniref:Agmatinase n=1 Tax=Desulfonauticus submarinus TaxID=206665 RepID=A0A1H0A060_9BACT|nr:agmatinase [Desulfonauticus submarinus]SDN26757.1 agmatinase [Desulfonauticus submarinus]
MNTFFDFTSQIDNKNKKKIFVLPCPYEGTVSYGTGTRFGPKAIMEASIQIETFDPELNISLEDYCYFKVLPEPKRNINSVSEYLKNIENILQQFDPKQEFFIALGGEHSITLPFIKFYSQFYKNLVVLQIDAHADLREEYEGSRYSHACVMKRCLEFNIDLIQVGIRSVCKEEASLIKQKKEQIHTFFAWNMKNPFETASFCKQIIGNRPLYITFDADGLDPSIMPGVGTPEPEGISYVWLKKFFFELFPVNFIGLDFCELAPVSSNVLSQSVAAKCIFKILTSYFYKCNKLL